VRGSILLLALPSFLLGIEAVFAQHADSDIKIHIKEVALLRVVPVTAEAGLFQLASASSDLKSLGIALFSSENRLQYTVVRKWSTAKMKIIAFLNQEPPAGFAFLARTQGNPAVGTGEQGSGTGEVELKTTGTDIIRDIGSCYTGAAPDSGPLIQVRMVRKSGRPAVTDQDLPRIQVTYAMVDQ
jgi:hypothetical protein